MNERELAAEILLEMESRDAYGNIFLRERLNRAAALKAHQKAFVTEIVNGCVRHKILLDYIVDRFSKTPSAKIKPFIRMVLRIAVYQLRFLDKVPAAAAVDEAVKLVKKRGFGALAGFVNAVLRAVTREPIEFPDKETDPVAFLSVCYSYPTWLAAYLLEHFGPEQAEAVCRANASRPTLHFCVNTLRIGQTELMNLLAEEGFSCSAAGRNGIEAGHSEDLSKKSSFQKGLYHVMDESAMRAVEVLAPQPGETVLDFCAAPGGKSFYTAYEMQNKGKIVAIDLYEEKLTQMRISADRLGIRILELRCADAAKDDFPKADRVLVDAPCTGFGVIRKKPDLKYRKSASDIQALAGLQKEILSHAQSFVKPGGILVYSTCTITSEENEENAAWFIRQFPFRLESAEQILPSHRDGFYIARFVREGL